MANKANWGLIAVLLVAAYLILGPVDLLGLSGDKVADDTTKDSTAQTLSCELDNTPTITPKYVDAYTAASVTASHNVWNDGVKVDDETGAFYGVAGVDYKILSNSSGTTYKSSWVTGMTKCQANEPIEIKMYNSGAPTLTFYNGDDQPSTAQALAADDSKTFKFKIAAGNNVCYGNPQANLLPADDVTAGQAQAGIVIAVNYNTSLYDKVSFDRVNFIDGDVFGATGEAKKVSVPQGNLSVMEEAYWLPVWAVCDLGEVKGVGTFETDSSNAPGANDDVLAYTYEPNLFMQVNSDDVVAGIENEDGTYKGIARYKLTLDVS